MNTTQPHQRFAIPSDPPSDWSDDDVDVAPASFAMRSILAPPPKRSHSLDSIPFFRTKPKAFADECGDAWMTSTLDSAAWKANASRRRAVRGIGFVVLGALFVCASWITVKAHELRGAAASDSAAQIAPLAATQASTRDLSGGLDVDMEVDLDDLPNALRAIDVAAPAPMNAVGKAPLARTTSPRSVASRPHNTSPAKAPPPAAKVAKRPRQAERAEAPAPPDFYLE